MIELATTRSREIQECLCNIDMAAGVPMQSSSCQKTMCSACAPRLDSRTRRRRAECLVAGEKPAAMPAGVVSGAR